MNIVITDATEVLNDENEVIAVAIAGKADGKVFYTSVPIENATTRQAVRRYLNANPKRVIPYDDSFDPKKRPDLLDAVVPH